MFILKTKGNLSKVYLLFFLHVRQKVLCERFQSLLQLLGIVKLLVFTLKTHYNYSVVIFLQNHLHAHSHTTPYTMEFTFLKKAGH